MQNFYRKVRSDKRWEVAEKTCSFAIFLSAQRQISKISALRFFAIALPTLRLVSLIYQGYVFTAHVKRKEPLEESGSSYLLTH